MENFIFITSKAQSINLNRKHLMILDGHISHITFKACIKSNEANLDLLFLRSCTFYVLQFLYITIFKPLNIGFRAYREIWTKNHGNKLKVQNQTE